MGELRGQKKKKNGKKKRTAERGCPWREGERSIFCLLPFVLCC